MDLDSHADTCCAGDNTRVVSFTGERVNVAPFSEAYDALKDIPIATVATVWECPKTMEVFLLIINEALYFGKKLKVSLLCPNQLRNHGIQVNDTPKQFDKSSTHSIRTEKGQEIPLEMDGVISYLQTRKPTIEEIHGFNKGIGLRSIVLTSDQDWEPYSGDFAAKEAEARTISLMLAPKAKTNGHNLFEMTGEDMAAYEMFERPDIKSLDRVASVAHRAQALSEPTELLDELTLATRLIAAVNVSVTDTDGDGLIGRTDEDLYTVSDDYRNVSAMSSKERGPVITKEILSKRWGIGMDAAHRTLTVTTQQGVRRVLHPTERRYRTRQTHLRFPSLNTRIYTDTMFASHKSLRGNTCAQLFTNGMGYDRFYPMKTKGDASESLMRFIQDSGVPRDLTSDRAPEEIQGRFRDVVNEYRIRHKTSEAWSYWQNHAEAGVREIKNGINRAKRRANSPRRLWDFCGEWVAGIRRLTAHNIPGLEGRVPEEVITGNTPDISEYCQFDWYETVWYYDNADFPEVRKKLGKWVGVAHDVGSPMCFWIIPESCIPIARTTVSSLTVDEAASPEIQELRKTLDEAIEERIGDKINQLADDLVDVFHVPPDDLFDDEPFEPMEPESLMPEADMYTPEAFDEYLNVEVMLPHGGEVLKAKVKSRKRDADGREMGTRAQNPILDTREYEVEFQDGSTDTFTANVVAENLYSQVDDEG
jgi:hypothetical protein